MEFHNIVVSIAFASKSEICGYVSQADAVYDWICPGSAVAIALSPPGTSYNDIRILGGGRVYEDRIEVDLLLSPKAVSALVEAVETSRSPSLTFSTRRISETMFRVVEIGVSSTGEQPSADSNQPYVSQQRSL